MTTPGGPTTPQNNWFAIGPSGTDRAKLENRSQSVMTDLLKSDQKPGIDQAFSGFNGGLIGVLQRVFTGIGGGILASGLQWLTDLFTLRWAQVDNVDARSNNIIAAIFNTWFNQGPPQAGQVAETIAAIKVAIYGNQSVYTLTGTGSFTVPQCQSLIICLVNGGGGGGSGQSQGNTSSAFRAAGGNGGNYTATIMAVADIGGVGAVVPYSAGLAGAGGNSGAGQLGGDGTVSRFGPASTPFIQGVVGVDSIATETGFITTTSKAGNGGSGGSTNGTGGFGGTSGMSTPLAIGGAGSGSTTVPGGNGGNANVSLSAAGGAGGGGGCSYNGGFSVSSGGGAGGSYGGGGGGGGSANVFSTQGPGGNGAPGAIYIITK